MNRSAIASVLALVLSACGDDSSPGNTSYGDGGSGTTGAGDGVAGTCVDEINRYRAMNGKPAYKRWSAEESCADGQAKSDSQSGKAHGAFGKCNEFGQNECPGWGGPADDAMIKSCLKAMWDEGPGGGHHDIMNSDNYTQVACGFYTTPDGKVWALQDFK